jgi:DDE_Tnp_1-associated
MGFGAGGVRWRGLLRALRRSPPPRQDNVRHDLNEVLIIALCTMLCGGEDCSDMTLFGEAKEPFLRQFLRLRHGIPSHDTFSRLLRRLDPAPFQACFVRFMERFAATLPGW